MGMFSDARASADKRMADMGMGGGDDKMYPEEMAEGEPAAMDRVNSLIDRVAKLDQALAADLQSAIDALVQGEEQTEEPPMDMAGSPSEPPPPGGGMAAYPAK